MADIASWDAKGNWINQSLPLMTKHDLPNLSDHQNLLLTRMKGKTPIHRFCRDSWGWGSSGVYTATSGYSHMQISVHASTMDSFGSHNAAI